MNLIKIVHFGENGQNIVILGAKITSYVKIWRKRSNIFSLKFSHSEPNGKIFPNFWRKYFLTIFPKFWFMTSFWPPKLPNFDHFQQKWTIFTKFTKLSAYCTLRGCVRFLLWNNSCYILKTMKLLPKNE